MTTRNRRLLFAAFFLSGISGLVCEAIWMRMLTFTFGSTTLAVSTALALEGMGQRQGASWVFPAPALQMNLSGWEFATDY